MTHTDGFSLYWPTGPAPEVFHYNQPAFKAMMLNFSDHMHAMSNSLVPASYPLSTEPPIITSLECKVRQGGPSTSSTSPIFSLKRKENCNQSEPLVIEILRLRKLLVG